MSAVSGNSCKIVAACAVATYRCNENVSQVLQHTQDEIAGECLAAEPEIGRSGESIVAVEGYLGTLNGDGRLPAIFAAIDQCETVLTRSAKDALKFL